MKNLIRIIRYFAPTCVVVLLLISFAGISASRPQQQIEPPSIVSKVRSLKILYTEIKGEGVEADAIIIIYNDTDTPVTAICIEVNDGKDAAGFTLNNFNESTESPKAVLEPYSAITVEFPLAHLRHVKPGTPIRIGGVMFADGTEEGDEDSLDTMHGQKAHYKAQKPKKDGKD